LEHLLESGISLTLLGMGVVFAILIVLSACIGVLGATSYRAEASASKGEENPHHSNDPPVGDERVVAAIVGALTAMTGAKPLGLRIKGPMAPIKGRQNIAPGWGSVGRLEIMAARARMLERKV